MTELLFLAVTSAATLLIFLWIDLGSRLIARLLTKPRDR
jgi:hypothetical protein